MPKITDEKPTIDVKMVIEKLKKLLEGKENVKG